MDFSQYANVETNLFPNVERRFRETGNLDAIDLWAILTWKANRSKNFHLKRLLEDGETLLQVAPRIAGGLCSARSPKDRLKSLMDDWGFKLPTATAVLSVLYPADFTIYDYRVCDVLGAFHELKGRKYSPKLWMEYERFKLAASARVPHANSWREVDHYLWGHSWYADAQLRVSSPLAQAQRDPTEERGVSKGYRHND